MGTTGSNLLYYSTSTYLSYLINRNFYKGKHFLWCSPVFDPESLDRLHPWYRIPPSSSPHKIYIRLFEDIKHGDMHSAKIKENRVGLKHGATIQLNNGVIDDTDFARINEMIYKASISDFKPLLYLRRLYIWLNQFN